MTDLPSAVRAYEARCIAEGRAPAVVPTAPQPAGHITAVDPRHYLQQAVVLASQNLDRAHGAVWAAERALAMRQKMYEAACAALRGAEG